jgi:NAD(P)-dependent dehydrogenase (short-subunit alcohol dehydrogenase family)
MTEIKGRTAVVTGGQRGLGKQLAAELLVRGAAKVYVTARTPVESDDPRLIPFAADITDPISVAALWSATNSMRVHLREQGTQVLGVYVGPIDTEMSRPLDVVKSPPEFVARTALDALEDGQSEVLVDDATRAVKATLSGPVEGLTFDL